MSSYAFPAFSFPVHYVLSSLPILVATGSTGFLTVCLPLIHLTSRSIHAHRIGSVGICSQPCSHCERTNCIERDGPSGPGLINARRGELTWAGVSRNMSQTARWLSVSLCISLVCWLEVFLIKLSLHWSYEFYAVWNSLNSDRLNETMHSCVLCQNSPQFRFVLKHVEQIQSAKLNFLRFQVITSASMLSGI